MKKFDWFTILGMLAIAENTIFMMALGGWWIVVGLMFGGFWVWIAYWDLKNRRSAQALDTASRSADIQAMSDTFRQIANYGVTVDEFASAFHNDRACIGDVTCRWNARSAFLRCAMNPSGECQGCKDYEEA